MGQKYLGSKMKATNLRRRRKLVPWSDFTQQAKTRPEDEGIPEQAQTWLFSLSAKELQTVFAYKHGWLVTLLRQMHMRKARDGDCSFMFKADKANSAEDTSLDSCFIIRPKHQDFMGKTETLPAEAKVEQAVRLWRSKECLDSLTLSLEALSSLSDIWESFQVITNGKFLKTPCRAYWDGRKVCSWETPKWFKPERMNSLAYWAVAALEKALWAKFWEASQLDGRRPHESAQVVYEQNSTLLSHCQTLADYWQNLDSPDRSSIVSELFKQTMKSSWVQLSSESAKMCQQELEELLSQVFPCEGISAQMMTYYHSEESFSELYSKLVDSPSEHAVELLYLTSLERAETPLDKLALRVAHKISDFHASKQAEELLAEDSTPKKLVPKKKKQPEPTKRISGKSSKSTSESSLSGDEGSVCPQTAQAKTAGVKTEGSVPGEEFVKVDRRRGRRPEEVKRTPMKHRGPKKTFKKISSPGFRPKPQPILNPGVVEWCDGSSSSRDILKVEEFPPLMSPPKVPAESLLSSSIMKLINSNSVKLLPLRQARHVLLCDVNDLVVSLFPSGFVQLYGSCATQLELPWSDIDLLVSNVHVNSQAELVLNLRRLASLLETQEWTLSVTLLDKAAVPVIKLNVKPNVIGQDSAEIDITFDDRSLRECVNLGLATTMVTLQYLTTYPLLNSLVPVLKQVLRVLNYNSSYKGTRYAGGLSSYTLLLWSVAFLNSRQSPPTDLGEALLQWLEFYGRHFDPKAQAVSVAEGGIVSLGGCYGYVVTRDPVRLSNNTTKGAFAISEIQVLFLKCARRLRESKHKHPLKELLRNPPRN
jgi:non-canonical poly(A) RNA polymerase PAPD5/7